MAEGCEQLPKLILNILEAVGEDLLQGNRDNAHAGLVLATNPFSGTHLIEKTREYKHHFDPHWASLYETWNLAFITANIGDLRVLYPKLLIPSVINAAPEDYLYYRTLSLWLALKLYLYAKIKDQKEHREELKVPHSSELAQILGAINAKYADEYSRHH
ncbi:MAG: hypothetical protein HQK52_12400 [Oligoflexia bacterium]|nr:hypothetical protein [Oligoflexia bacterium]